MHKFDNFGQVIDSYLITSYTLRKRSEPRAENSFVVFMGGFCDYLIYTLFYREKRSLFWGAPLPFFYCPSFDRASQFPIPHGHNTPRIINLVWFFWLRSTIFEYCGHISFDNLGIYQMLEYFLDKKLWYWQELRQGFFDACWLPASPGRLPID